MDSNENHTCYYFDDIILIEDFDLDDISIDVKSNESILVYEILHKILIGSKPLRIRFNKMSYKCKKWHEIYMFSYYAKIKAES